MVEGVNKRRLDEDSTQSGNQRDDNVRENLVN